MDKVIDKIKKLLALANSPNEHEAKLASKKAHELIMMHNLSMATIEKEAQEFKTESNELKKRQPVEDKFIHSILQKYFFVKVIYNRADMTLDFIGKKENIEVALFVKSFLANSFKSIYKTKAKEMNWSNGMNRNAFYLGIFRGIMDQLEEQKKEVVAKNEGAANSLMVIDRALSEYIQNSIGPVRTKSAGRISGDNSAVRSGYEEGKNLRIARGLGNKSEESGRYLN